jgi:hypothetical protein
MLTTWISAGARTFLTTGALLLTLHAAAAPLPLDGIMLAGHEPLVDPALRRFTGVVVGLGTANKAGHVYTLRLKPLGPGMAPPAPNEMRGWRLTVLAGNRFGSVFWVKSNTASEITVRSKEGALDGMNARDVFVVEQLNPDAPLPPTSRRDDHEPQRLG